MNTSDLELHQMNPQGRFSNRAEDYAKYRPSYPTEAIEFILEGWQDSAKLTAVDIGAGTGISSRLLADKKVKVIAIEPNGAMRQAATPHPLVKYRDGNAENTNLPNSSVDLVTCFQSFHWFEIEPTLREFQRILKPEGKIALVWNDRDIDGKDEFTRQHGQIIDKVGGKSSVAHRMNKYHEQYISSLLPNVRYRSFPYRQPLDKTSLIGLAMSSSYIPKAGVSHQQLVNDLNELHSQHCDRQSLVYLYYKTSVYVWEYCSSFASGKINIASPKE
ncbi:class I SAM-dependent methyltransferase [Myxosarcina sp. GI1]|uniref:class I SAM-dependent methyltransferase n=1 Tax=Myxosarcina sp. GI1 TaxID=1541065 RepID=UPI000689726E|nr:class I SAM-dependent methyltransferase [Myxosarcina sp. GI1]